MSRKRVVILLGIALSGVLGGVFGILVGNISGGVMASIFWHKETFSYLIMISLCFSLICTSTYYSIKTVKLWYKLGDSDRTAAMILKTTFGIAFLVTFSFQMVIWGIATIGYR